MSVSFNELETLVLHKAPAPDSAWLRAEAQFGFSVALAHGKQPTDLQRQKLYAEECREQLASVTAIGATDQHLQQGIRKREMTVQAADGFRIPVIQLDSPSMKNETAQTEVVPDVILVYFHGGGLRVGEADSEELSCRRIIKSFNGNIRLYSVGYRLMPEYPASVCISDAIDAFKALSTIRRQTIVVGSSSGGQLAASVAQQAPQGSCQGLLLRCPVTCDPSDEKAYVPKRFHRFHTSRDESFATTIFQYLRRTVVRDGLDSLPLEASQADLARYPRTWIQLCTNDTLYSDGLCLAMALVEVGVEVKIDIWQGWPHTFWLKAPLVAESSKAESAVTGGLRWLLR